MPGIELRPSLCKHMLYSVVFVPCWGSGSGSAFASPPKLFLTYAQAKIIYVYILHGHKSLALSQYSHHAMSIGNLSMIPPRGKLLSWNERIVPLIQVLKPT